MDVTRSNFAKVLQDLDQVVSDASFLAVDGEFTGLMDDGPNVGAYDTPGEYYKKLRDGSMKFLFVQFGLCAFKYNSSEKQWTHNAYNFYVFPKPINRQYVDTRFLCQSSSIDFLSTNGFDFNKLFREGIQYLTIGDEERLTENMKKRHSKELVEINSDTNTDKRMPIEIPSEHVKTVQENSDLIKDFVMSPKSELKLKRCNAFVRRLMYQTVSERFADSVRLETRSETDGSRSLVAVRNGSEAERLEHLKERHKNELQELDESIGFSKVVRLLTRSGKLIVGHNMMLDMCHILNQFVSPIPEDYAQFKAMLHTLFPSILDTKYVSGCSAFKQLIKNNMLCDLYARLQETPFSVPSVACETEGCGYLSSQEKYHEAGYDAYVTGLCLLAMAKYLDKSDLHPDISNLPKLKPFINKILLYRIQDFGFVNLEGNDPVLPRDHVFHVTFPEEWKQYDIIKLFMPICGVQVSWIDSTSAYVGLYERERSGSVMSKLKPGAGVRITPYAKHRQSLGPMTVLKSPATDKQRRKADEEMVEVVAGNKRKRKAAQPHESKFSRRSIGTILESEEEPPPPPPPPPHHPADAQQTPAPASVPAATERQFEESDDWV